MINLLPQKEKQNLILEKKEKLSVILGFMVLVSLFCLALVLLSVEFYVLSDTNYQKIILEEAQKKNQINRPASSKNIILKYNGILSQLDSFYKKEIYFNHVLDIISNIQKPQNLYLANYSLIRDENGKIKVDVSGVSNTRDDLLLFQKNIETDSEIENPYFSPESWISPKNANFTLSFEISQNEKGK
jgi:hypothetical protein